MTLVSDTYCSDGSTEPGTLPCHKELGRTEGTGLVWSRGHEGSRSGFETTDDVCLAAVLAVRPQHSWGSGQVGTVPQAGHSLHTRQVSSWCP